MTKNTRLDQLNRRLSEEQAVLGNFKRFAVNEGIERRMAGHASLEVIVKPAENQKIADFFRQLVHHAGIVTGTIDPDGTTRSGFLLTPFLDAESPGVYLACFNELVEELEIAIVITKAQILALQMGVEIETIKASSTAQREKHEVKTNAGRRITADVQLIGQPSIRLEVCTNEGQNAFTPQQVVTYTLIEDTAEKNGMEPQLVARLFAAALEKLNIVSVSDVQAGELEQLGILDQDMARHSLTNPSNGSSIEKISLSPDQPISMRELLSQGLITTEEFERAKSGEVIYKAFTQSQEKSPGTLRHFRGAAIGAILVIIAYAILVIIDSLPRKN